MKTFEDTKWWDTTWNPVVGCSHISEGCLHCYGARLASRRLKHLDKYRGLAVNCRWTDWVRMCPEELEIPRKWKKPRRIFAISMGDLWHEALPEKHVHEILDVMRECGQHTFMVVTKRPERARELLGDEPPKNLWLGVTAENQKRADERIPVLLEIPVAVRFVSVEPMLGPVNLLKWLDPDLVRRIDWTICGAETGPNRRPMSPDWAGDLRGQCGLDGVPFFFKQATGETPSDLKIREFPKGES